MVRLSRATRVTVAYGVAAYLTFLAILYPSQALVERWLNEQLPWPIRLGETWVRPWGIGGSRAEMKAPGLGPLVFSEWSITPDWNALHSGSLGVRVRGSFLDGRLEGELRHEANAENISLIWRGAAHEALAGLFRDVRGVLLRGRLVAGWESRLREGAMDRPGRFRVTWEHTELRGLPSLPAVQLGRGTIEGQLSGNQLSGSLMFAGGEANLTLQFRASLTRPLPDSLLQAEGRLAPNSGTPPAWRRLLTDADGEGLPLRVTGSFSRPRVNLEPRA